MSKYTIVHECCGYTEEVQIYGKESERPAKAAYLAKQPCIKCRAKAARESGITEGSDKQVAWAKDIRDGMIAKLDAYRGFAQADALADLATEWIDAHHDARWYIDNRDLPTAKEILGLIPAEEQREMAERAMEMIGA